MTATTNATMAPVQTGKDPYFDMTKQRIDQAANEIRELFNQLHSGSGTNQREVAIEEIHQRWNLERQPILDHIKFYQDSLIGLDKVFKDETNFAQTRFTGIAGLSKEDEARIQQQLTVARGKLVALENSLVASGYTEYRPIGPDLEFSTTPLRVIIPQENVEIETGPRQRGRPAGSKNKVITKKGGKGATHPKQKMIAQVASRKSQQQSSGSELKTSDLVGAIITSFGSTGKSSMKVVEIADAIKTHCNIDAKTSEVLGAINSMVDNGTMVFEKDKRSYSLAT
jgi:hypothetical protein